MSNAVLGRAVVVLAIRAVIVPITAQVMLVDPCCYRGTVAQRAGALPQSKRRGLLCPGSRTSDFTLTGLLWAGARGSEPHVLGWRRDLDSADGDFCGFTGKTLGVRGRICSSFLALPQVRNTRYAAHSGTSGVCPLGKSSQTPFWAAWGVFAALKGAVWAVQGSGGAESETRAA